MPKRRTPPPDLHEIILATPAQAQGASPLFTIVPAEIRSEIFKYVLTDYPDPSPDKQYGAATCYTRPAYYAPSKSDTRLLRTCRAVYQECWFLPFTLREHIHWATAWERAPPEYNPRVSPAGLRTLTTIAQRQPFSPALAALRRRREASGPHVEVGSLRVFAQMYKLEEGGLCNVLRNQRLMPRKVTLTIRHADWWLWENDEPLHFNGNWITPLSDMLPATVTEFNIELESLERKKHQVQEIAKQMTEKWFLRRLDDAILFADCKVESRWSGTSTWHGKRWVRDETSPGIINYYIMTVTFRPEYLITRRGGTINPIAKANSQKISPLESDLMLEKPEWTAMQHPEPWVEESE